jgi:hypothetical protein
VATAEKRMVEKTRMVEEKYIEQDGVNLQLSEDEVFVLYLLLNRAGGARSGPRGHLDSIRGALVKAGIEWDYSTSKADAKISGYPIFPDQF